MNDQGSLQNIARRKKRLSKMEKKVNKVVAKVRTRAERPYYVIADSKDGYSNVRIVSYKSERFTMKDNGYIWNAHSKSWITFYKLLLGLS